MPKSESRPQPGPPLKITATLIRRTMSLKHNGGGSRLRNFLSARTLTPDVIRGNRVHKWAGAEFALRLSMIERRVIADRRQKTRSGRRHSDPQPENRTSSDETRRELAQLKTVIGKLLDEVQALTATVRKP